jgi:hypothetical protein
MKTAILLVLKWPIRAIQPGVPRADTSGMKRSLSYVLAASLVVSLSASAHAADRWGAPRIWHDVTSAGVGPARTVTVMHDLSGRVAYEFHTRVRFWNGEKLVFHGDHGGRRQFRARYRIWTADGWQAITRAITSDRGFVFGRVDSADVTIRLVVDRGPHSMRIVPSSRTFTVTAGVPGGPIDRSATAIFETPFWTG